MRLLVSSAAVRFVLPSCWRVFFASVGLPCIVAGAANAQNRDEWHVADAVHGRYGRVVFPATADIDLHHVRRILQVLDDHRVLPGLPSHGQLDREITVSLALDIDVGTIHAWSKPEQHLIVLPMRKSFSWNDLLLKRIVRHEIAHVALSEFLGHRNLPRWFEEGFAEWVAGGLTLEGEARLEIEVRRRHVGAMPMPALEEIVTNVPDRLAYDFYSNFFDFLEFRLGDELRNGFLLEDVRNSGVRLALANALDGGLDALELEWRSHLLTRFLDRNDVTRMTRRF